LFEDRREMYSCDTFVVLGEKTNDGRVIVGKNSDRDPSEPNNVRYYPAGKHQPDAQLQCTYITIPQVAETHAILLLQPSWIWGGEYGVNSFGVTIGNEALFSAQLPKSPALLGMDLLRLGLERSKTAFEALQVIIQLLETHGQGGNCGFTSQFYYNNAFLIADRKEAYILETHFRDWAWKRVKDFAVISNIYSIQDDWNEISPRLQSTRSSSKSKRFNFSSFSDITHTTASQACHRRETIQKFISANDKFEVSHAMKILRSHTKQDYDPKAKCFEQSVCMHYAGYVRRGQTTGSMIAHLSLALDDPSIPLLDTIWTTGTSAPCISSYKPIIGIDSLPGSLLGVANQVYDQYSFWWKGEHLHRLILIDYPNRAPLAKVANSELEGKALAELSRFGDRIRAGNEGLDELRKQITLQSFVESIKITDELIGNLSRRNVKSLCVSVFTIWYRFNWAKRNQLSYLKPIHNRWQVWAIPSEFLTLSLIGVGFFVCKRLLQRNSN